MRSHSVQYPPHVPFLPFLPTHGSTNLCCQVLQGALVKSLQQTELDQI